MGFLVVWPVLSVAGLGLLLVAARRRWPPHRGRRLGLLIGHYGLQWWLWTLWAAVLVDEKWLRRGFVNGGAAEGELEIVRLSAWAGLALLVLHGLLQLVREDDPRPRRPVRPGSTSLRHAKHRR